MSVQFKFGVLFLLLLFIGSNVSYAQNPRERFSPQKENELVFANIEGLSKKQKEKIAKVNSDHYEALKALFEKPEMDRETKVENRKRLRLEKTAAIQNILTAVQFEKYQRIIKAAMEQRRKSRPSKRNRSNN